jgi:hypothetical protein
MAIPYVEKFRQVIDVGEIDLRLDGVAERAAAGFQRRLQPVSDQEFGLQPNVGAVPHRVGRPIGLRVEPGHRLVVRHLPGDEDIVAAHERGDEAGMLRHRHALRARRPRLAAVAGQHREHRHVHVGTLHQQLFHQHRGARRNVVAQHRLARPLIRVHAFGPRVILIHAHDMAQVAAFGGDQLGEAGVEEIALAAVARGAAERQPRRARHRGGDAVREIGRLVAGEEQPWPGAHALGEFDLGLTDAHRSDGRDRGHSKPPYDCMSKATSRARRAMCETDLKCVRAEIGKGWSPSPLV